MQGHKVETEPGIFRKLIVSCTNRTWYNGAGDGSWHQKGPLCQAETSGLRLQPKILAITSALCI